jgi:23S rRNA (adenine2503-C2)-methyltransferase
MNILKSEIDPSVNFIEQQLIGFTESRYVRKKVEYFICYLSSQTGCNQGCRFCHLTATKQFKNTDCVMEDYLNQVENVFGYYSKEIPAETCHYNFMARGEVLDNKWFCLNAPYLFEKLGRFAFKYNVYPKFNLSTIIPKKFLDEYSCLTDVFDLFCPTIYYSLYSTNSYFRNKWMPKAGEIGRSLNLLKKYQVKSKKILKIHHCFIEGENDSIKDLEEMVRCLDFYGLMYEFNLVRYNPYNKEQGREASENVIMRNLYWLKENVKGKVQEIPRVGPDVYASCGMFMEKSKCI